MKRADRRRWESTVAKRQGSGRETVAERSRRQTSDPRNTKRQRGRVRAASVRENAKPRDHQDAPSRAAGRGRKAHVLTQGDLPGASLPGVSRGRSSVEAGRKPGGAKGRRNECKATREPVSREENTPTSADCSAQSRNSDRTRTAQVVQPPQSARGEELRRTCGTQGTRQPCKR